MQFEIEGCGDPQCLLCRELTRGERAMAMTTYGEMLREWRTARGVSQRDLAEMTSCDHTYLSKIESGALAAPSDDLSRKLAMALSINPDLLINLSAKPPQDWGDTLASNPRGVQVLRLLSLCRYSDDTYEAMRQTMLAELGYDPFMVTRAADERIPGDPILTDASQPE